MTSKYSIAKEAIEASKTQAEAAGIDLIDVQEALLISVIEALKTLKEPDDLRGILQYEVDSLNSGGVHEVQRR